MVLVDRDMRGQALSFTPISLEGVFNGKKTQTRRMVKSGDVMHMRPRVDGCGGLEILRIDSPTGRRRWEVGCVCKVTPGRGRAAVAEVRIMALRYEDVRLISVADAEAEYYGDPAGFLFKWAGFYDREGMRKMHRAAERGMIVHADTLRDQPDELYRGFVLDFELVEVY